MYTACSGADFQPNLSEKKYPQKGKQTKTCLQGKNLATLHFFLFSFQPFFGSTLSLRYIHAFKISTKSSIFYKPKYPIPRRPFLRCFSSEVDSWKKQQKL
jgi:hypothetical protein